MGDDLSELATSVVLASIVSKKFTPVASAVPVLETTTVYIIVSPGFTGVLRLSVLVAVMIGAGGGKRLKGLASLTAAALLATDPGWVLLAATVGDLETTGASPFELVFGRTTRQHTVARIAASNRIGMVRVIKYLPIVCSLNV